MAEESAKPTKWLQKVLIVEDSEPTRKLMVRYFEKAKANKHLNCEIYEAKDGKEAALIMEKTQPDLILSDINMPVMDGLKLLMWFRKVYLQKHPFAVFFLPAPKSASEPLTLGPWALLPKTRSIILPSPCR